MKTTASIIGSIIGIALLYFAYDYLRKLEDCMCAQGVANAEENKADIQKLKYIELLLLVIAILNLIFSLNTVFSPLIATFFTIAIVVIYVFFVMNVYRLYRNMPSDCECALKWPRYYLYIQALLMTMVLIVIFIMIFTIFYVAHKTKGNVNMKPKRK